MAIEASKALKCAVLAAAAALLMGCAKKDDAINQAEKNDVAQGVPAPSIADTKAIAQEGFVWGLPLVMNYAVMNEYAIDTTSRNTKRPSTNRERTPRVDVRGHRDGTPNSDTPYSFVGMDMRAEPLVVSLPAMPRTAISRCSWLMAIPIITATSAAARPGMGGRLSHCRPRLEGRDAGRHQESLCIDDAFCADFISHATL